jgi:hypothetical protein
MSEANEPKKTALAQAREEAMVVDTMGGRVHVRWDETAQATPHGQIVFFAEFLATAGVFDRWVQACPLRYNPHKPGRPSHVLHTFWVGNLRLVLDAVLGSGKQHTSGHAKAAMARLLDELGDKAPALVRGDCGYGNEDIIDVCEQRGLSYLLRLRKTANVKRLIERLFRREDWTRATDASQGWQAIEDELWLSGGGCAGASRTISR